MGKNDNVRKASRSSLTSRKRSRGSLNTPRSSAKTQPKSGKTKPVTRFSLPKTAVGRSPFTSQSGMQPMQHLAVSKKDDSKSSRSVLGRAAGRAKGERRVGFGEDSHRTITGRWQGSDSSESSLNGTGWSKMSGYRPGTNNQSSRMDDSDYPSHNPSTQKPAPKFSKKPNSIMKNGNKPKGILKKSKRHSMPAIPEVGSTDSDSRNRSIDRRISHPLTNHKRLAQRRNPVITHMLFRPRARSEIKNPPRQNNRPQIETGRAYPAVWDRPSPDRRRASAPVPPVDVPAQVPLRENPAPDFDRRRRTREMHCRGCAVQ